MKPGRRKSTLEYPATGPDGVQPTEKLSFGTEIVKESGRSKSGARTVSTFNDRMALFLVALVLIAPIPMGSNRPVPWMVWSFVLNLALIVQIVTLSRLDPKRPLRSAAHRPVFIAGVSFGLFALLQILPLGLFQSNGLIPETISLVPRATILGALRFASYGALFMLVLEVTTQATRIRRMAWTLFFGLVAHAVWAMVSLTLFGDQFFWGEKTAYIGAATGTFINRNSFATFMGMGQILGLCLTMERANRPHMRRPGRNSMASPDLLETVFLWMYLMLIALALLASQSRMGVFATFLGALVAFVVMRSKGTGNSARAVLQALGIGVLAVVATLVLFGRALIERSLFTVQNGETRVQLWRQTLGMIRERPWTGYGLDNFRAAFELFHRPPLSVSVTWEYAHSTYLTLWAEMGLIVGSLPLIAVMYITLRIVRVLRSRKNDYAISVAAAGIVVLGAFHSLVDFSLEMEANVFLFLTILGMGAAQLRRKRARSDGW
ncbi:O-antigen ligase family protein [Candidatus Halocynthiibacter alkanivorans]|uniref:O-antigen ligase family protein n=1 Tax=Candidatus Halocynthiibacter alkanivorans TaxID=2267619 RepID=UPI000DF16B2E|nr:O-antigen ligase family protein [Candidatus Halocynthiibacter alkanivorans]